jgi:hypothetical protein
MFGDLNIMFYFIGFDVCCFYDVLIIELLNMLTHLVFIVTRKITSKKIKIAL